MASSGYCSNYTACGTAAGKRVVDLKTNRDHCPDCGTVLHPIADMEPLLAQFGASRRGAPAPYGGFVNESHPMAASQPQVARTEHFSDAGPKAPAATLTEAPPIAAQTVAPPITPSSSTARPFDPAPKPSRLPITLPPQRILVAAGALVGVLVCAVIAWALIARGGAAAPLAVRLCGSNVIGGRLGADLIQGFFSNAGGAKIAVSAFDAAGDASVGAEINGKASRIALRADGSSSAYADVAAGTCQAAIVDRPPTPSELTALRARFAGAPSAARPIARDGVAVVVNPSNGVGQLTLPQVGRILSGDVTNWSQVGGPSRPIVVIAPPDNSDIVTMLDTRVLAGRAITVSARRFTSERGLAGTVAHDRDAIGLVPFSDSSPAKAVALGTGSGFVAPSSLSIGKTYPLSMHLGLYAPPGGNDTLASHFTDYLGTTDAANIIGNAGLVPAGP